MIKLNILYQAPGKIKPYDHNPRQNDGAVDAVAKSIKSFDFRVPIVVDADNTIVAGHTRWKAAKKLGLKEVPTVYAADLTPEQIRAYRIADNSTADLAEWDPEFLADEVAQLPDFDFADFGLALDDERQPDDEITRPDLGEDSVGWSVQIICKTEREQADVYNEMQKRGYECRLSS